MEDFLEASCNQNAFKDLPFINLTDHDWGFVSGKSLICLDTEPLCSSTPKPNIKPKLCDNTNDAPGFVSLEGSVNMGVTENIPSNKRKSDNFSMCLLDIISSLEKNIEDSRRSYLDLVEENKGLNGEIIELRINNLKLFRDNIDLMASRNNYVKLLGISAEMASSLSNLKRENVKLLRDNKNLLELRGLLENCDESFSDYI